MKKIYFIIISIFIIVFPNVVGAKELDYIIKSYDIDIVVNENNVMNITENIETYFNVQKHGIFRKIPVRNVVNRLDGSKSNNRVVISDIYVNNNYIESKDLDYLTIKIGDAGTYLTGLQKYTIKYNYDIGKDPLDDIDELYFNIIGNEWDTTIDNITFKVTMPKDFDETKLGFSKGLKGDISNENIIYNVSNNVITGSYNHLNLGEALTIRCELPEEYFINENVPETNYLIFIVPFILLIISLLLWNRFGKYNTVVETIEFYPPNNLNSIDIGYIYKGKTSKKDVISLLIYLANKGYIEISDKKLDIDSKKVELGKDSKKRVSFKILDLQNKIELERKTNPNSKKIKYYENMLNIYNNIDTPIDYKKYDLEDTINKKNKNINFYIKKLKEYDGNDQNERIFLEGLFGKKGSIADSSSLYDSFYITIDRIIKLEENKYKNIIIEKENKGIKLLLVIFIMFITFFIITLPIISVGMYEIIFPMILTTVIGVYLLLLMILGKSDILLCIICMIFGFIFSVIPWLYYMLPILKDNIVYLIGFVFGLLVTIVICIIYKHMDRKTKFGTEMFGKVKGFRRFLKTAEASKLEQLVNDNPNYFYDILPYTYVLGISNKWIKKFESIINSSPTWYNSDNSFDYNKFDKFLGKTVKTITKTSNYSSSSFSSSSSSSGGGFSGGGSGGGGGGSW